MINVSDSAVSKIKTLLEEENNDKLKLRAFVQGGGCSGMQYGFTFDEDQNDDDHMIDIGGVSVLVDSVSLQYLSGSTIDYKQDFMGHSFSIDNPNAQSTCGCGNSFSPNTF